MMCSRSEDAVDLFSSNGHDISVSAAVSIAAVW